MRPAAAQVPSTRLRERAALRFFTRLDRDGRLALARASLDNFETPVERIVRRIFDVARLMQQAEDERGGGIFVDQEGSA